MKNRESIYTPEEVCEMIDCFPGVMPEVANVMKAAVRNGECPAAIRHSLKLTPVVCFRKIGE